MLTALLQNEGSFEIPSLLPQNSEMYIKVSGPNRKNQTQKVGPIFSKDGNQTLLHFGINHLNSLSTWVIILKLRSVIQGCILSEIRHSCFPISFIWSYYDFPLLSNESFVEEASHYHPKTFVVYFCQQRTPTGELLSIFISQGPDKN